MVQTEKPIRILLIDDHQTMLWGLGRLIEGQRPAMEVAGYASTCEEALAQTVDLAPDIVLLDLDLAGVCSLDIIPAILAACSPKILVLTGVREQVILDSAIRRGARGVVYKGDSAEQLLKAIEKVYCGELWLDQKCLGRVLNEFISPAQAQVLDPEKQSINTLTARERKIIQVIVQESGDSNKEIAVRLFISEHTLRNHLTSIYQKLHVSSRLELYVYAVKHHLGNDPVVSRSTDSPRNAGWSLN